jgi:hypothetical protein
LNLVCHHWRRLSRCGELWETVVLDVESEDPCATRVHVLPFARWLAPRFAGVRTLSLLHFDEDFDEDDTVGNTKCSCRA